MCSRPSSAAGIKILDGGLLEGHTDQCPVVVVDVHWNQQQSQVEEVSTWTVVPPCAHLAEIIVAPLPGIGVSQLEEFCHEVGREIVTLWPLFNGSVGHRLDPPATLSAHSSPHPPAADDVAGTGTRSWSPCCDEGGRTSRSPLGQIGMRSALGCADVQCTGRGGGGPRCWCWQRKVVAPLLS